MSTLSTDNRKKQEQQLAGRLTKLLFAECPPHLLGLYIMRVYAEYTRHQVKDNLPGFHPELEETIFTLCEILEFPEEPTYVASMLADFLLDEYNQSQCYASLMYLLAKYLVRPYCSDYPAYRLALIQHLQQMLSILATDKPMSEIGPKKH